MLDVDRIILAGIFLTSQHKERTRSPNGHPLYQNVTMEDNATRPTQLLRTFLKEEYLVTFLGLFSYYYARICI